MFPNWQDIYSQVEAKHAAPIVEALRNNVVNSPVSYKNRANSILQMKLSQIDFIQQFCKTQTQFCTWNVL